MPCRSATSAQNWSTPRESNPHFSVRSAVSCPSWTKGRCYRRRDLNPDLVRSVLSCPGWTTPARHKLLAGGEGLEPSFFGSEPNVLAAERPAGLGDWDSNPGSEIQSLPSLPLDDRPTIWGDRRELNPRGRLHRPPPEPLGHGHNWWLRERSNLRNRLFRPALVRLSYAAELGGPAGI